MEEYQYKPIRLGAQIRINTKGLVHALRNPFVKVEDQTRKYRPDIVEMKSFPYLDFNNEGTSSPFILGLGKIDYDYQKKKSRTIIHY